jgi:hypothetical protein
MILISLCSCLLLYQKPHYMLFITLPETTLYVVYYSTRNHTICCLLLYQKPHYMLFIVSVSVFFASSLYLDFRVLDITLTMFTLDFTFIPQRIRLVVLRYRYYNLQVQVTGFTGSLWSPDYTVAQVIYNYSIVNLIKSYPHDTLTTCSCYL